MRWVFALAVFAVAASSPADEIDRKFPLSDQMRVLVDDASSPSYRKLVDEMLMTDLNAEWQRSETDDGSERFLQEHGGRDKVLADPALRAAYERRRDIETRFLDVMREGYRRYKKPAPFDEGATAEKAGTVSGKAAGEGTNLSIVLPAAGSADQWPRFRGPTGQGNSAARDLPRTWSRTENVAWRTPLPGAGNSSPIIWNDRIFLTSSGENGTERTLHCLDAPSGRILWSRAAPAHEPEPNVRDKNGFASATPVTDGQRVIAFLGSCGMVAYDFSGKLLWHYETPKFNTTWGTGSSPLLYEDLVILAQDQNKAESLFIALDKYTGQLRWKQPREKAMGWSTPIVVRTGNRDELVYAGGETIRGYDPQSGRELWSLSGPTREVIPTVIIGGELLFCASGRQGPTLGVRPGGSGDVTDTHLAWRTARGGPHVPTPVLYRDRLYTVNDTGIVTCLDAPSGKLLWQSRLRDKFSASPLESEGVLYCPSESGKTYLLQTGDKLDVIAENDLGAPILASPAALGNSLYLRTVDELFCLRKSNSK